MKCLFMSLAHFSSVFFLLIYCWNCIYCLYSSVYEPLMCCRYLFPSVYLSFQSFNFSVVSLCSESWGYFPILTSKIFIVFTLSDLICVYHAQNSRSPVLFLSMWIFSVPVIPIEKIIFSHILLPCQKSLMICMWICFSAHFILLFYLSLL